MKLQCSRSISLDALTSATQQAITSEENPRLSELILVLDRLVARLYFEQTITTCDSLIASLGGCYTYIRLVCVPPNHASPFSPSYSLDVEAF